MTRAAPATIIARPDPRRPDDARSRTRFVRPRRAAPRSRVMLLFASDMHLAAHRPGAVAAFLAFLSGPVRRADRLCLLGDVFDLWLGDDDDRAPHPEVEAALAGTVAAGVPIDLIRGNHDFLLGEAFAEPKFNGLLPEFGGFGHLSSANSLILLGFMFRGRDVVT